MKRKALRVAIEIAVVLVIIVIFFILNDQIKQSRESSFYFVNDGSEYAYQVENVSLDDDYLTIRGWFFELKSVKNEEREVNDSNKLEVLLYDLAFVDEKDLDGKDKPKTGISLDITYEDRNDVNDYFKCQYDYSHCGFVGKVKKDRLKLDEVNYQIVFKLDENGNNGVGSSYYLLGGELSSTVPSEQIHLDVEGTDLKKIIENGNYVGGNTNNHVYIYQYEWQLYYIVDSDDFFSQDGNTFIEYMMDTTQFDKLPSYRTDNGWYWGNIGGTFESYEVTDKMDCGKYRVSVRDIPTEHSVTRISTGQYKDGQWIWQSLIRPVYNFEK